MQEWLNDLKLRLSISDTFRDQLLLDYLKISHEAVWTQYYQMPLPTNSYHPWYRDAKTKMATLHLAVTLFSNPDINLEAKDVKDDRMMMRILADRMVY